MAATVRAVLGKINPYGPRQPTRAQGVRVVVNEDAEPFVRQGRNVFHGFIVACDEWISPGKTCLLVNPAGELLGHGVSNGTLADMKTFQKGVAVKTRGGMKQ